MATNTTTFGATIVPTPTRSDTLLHLDSPALTPVASRDGSQSDPYSAQPPSIQSPFYTHPPASNEVVPQHTKSTSTSIKDTLAVFEKDVESGNATPLTPADEEDPFSRPINVESNKEDTMWPSKQTLKQKRKEERQLRRDRKGCTGCAPLRNHWSEMSRKQRLGVKIGIAAFLIGVAVALGVGISVAVKGTYYVADGSSKSIG
ncbi:hypothetical protein DOTSEDRAFT_75350 [Lecanosticta acicola]|uniref:Uncharacterized protein n=1 Tax=Lecanosticta acicola TaxID=111012 RepID=A0AAI9E815_9PEZI|nr:hypothetical protein DOTSEDRAFT_75350 [Lecanosticta acicola]